MLGIGVMALSHAIVMANTLPCSAASSVGGNDLCRDPCSATGDSLRSSDPCVGESSYPLIVLKLILVLIDLCIIRRIGYGILYFSLLLCSV